MCGAEDHARHDTGIECLLPPRAAQAQRPPSSECAFQPGREELLCDLGAPHGRRRTRGRSRSSRSVEAAHRPVEHISNPSPSMFPSSGMHGPVNNCR
jgi:hypothetical protein